ncbi:uncharacterized protein LOC133746966 [Lepus europaeus]|uniref:uncharacterized protein LOC133746966 n=1 Tax=Lepus europaeus TaxID=9983 RepID=UPI002B4A2CFF|nr:uncharacterized protein LOC133746966 [Lepus europaeus]
MAPRDPAAQPFPWHPGPPRPSRLLETQDSHRPAPSLVPRTPKARPLFCTQDSDAQHLPSTRDPRPPPWNPRPPMPGPLPAPGTLTSRSIPHTLDVDISLFPGTRDPRHPPWHPFPHRHALPGIRDPQHQAPSLAPLIPNARTHPQCPAPSLPVPLMLSPFPGTQDPRHLSSPWHPGHLMPSPSLAPNVQRLPFTQDP